MEYRVIASCRGVNPADNYSETYCTTDVGFVDDATLSTPNMTKTAADAIYAATAADGSPYSMVCLVSVDAMEDTVVLECKKA